MVNVHALVTSDAHAGLVAAIGATLPGAAWQRCRTLLHSVFDRPDAESIAAQYDQIIEALAHQRPKVTDRLDGARPDLLASTAFRKQIWRQIWSNNLQELLNEEIRRRTGVVGM